MPVLTGSDPLGRAARAAAAAVAQAQVAGRALGLARSALSPSGPFATPLADAIGAVEESVSVLASGRLGPAELDRLAAAARRAEAAMGSLQILALAPGPIGAAGRLVGLLRAPLRAWSHYVARDPQRPDVPSPLELAAGER